MNKKDLLYNIQTLTKDKNGVNQKYNLNIYRGKHTIKEAWNIHDGLIVKIIDNKNNKRSRYISDINIHDQIFIYRKLLKLDIYKRLKKSEPDKTKKDIYKLTMKIFNIITNQKKVIHKKY